MKNFSLRKLIALISFLLVPITFIYVSPVIIILDSRAGVISGSFILYSLLFLTSLFTGRLFCSWICPFGGIQECMMSTANKPVRRSRLLHIIRNVIWVAWIGVIVFTAVSSGGYHSVDPQGHAYNGISLHTEGGLAYPIYFIVLALLLVFTLVLGRRGGCHVLCPMSNFMIIGRKLGRLIHLPQVHLKADSSRCVSCEKCSEVCPMSLEVEGFVKRTLPEGSSCILCGDCAKVCSNDALWLSFGKEK
jgi:polyferredoxin